MDYWRSTAANHQAGKTVVLAASQRDEIMLSWSHLVEPRGDFSYDVGDMPQPLIGFPAATLLNQKDKRRGGLGDPLLVRQILA